MPDGPPLWERQAWDTNTSFDRFTRFFLVQTPPRSVDEAYRRYFSEKNQLPPGDTSVASKKASGPWQNWSRGQDSAGQPIDGAKSWRVRAAAYDDYLAEQDRLTRERRRAEILESGLALDYERVQELKVLADFLIEQMNQQDEAGNYANVWLPDVKQIGGGNNAERVDIVRFNAAIIDQLRGVLDDLAKETGGRIRRNELFGQGDGGAIPHTVRVVYDDLLSPGDDDDGSDT